MPPTPARIVAPIPTVAPILTGHYQEGPEYASWRPHGTRDWLLIYTVGGRGRFETVGQGERRANPGDLVLLRPGTLHDYGTARGAALWDILWTHFLPRPHWQDWLAAWPDTAPGLVHLSLGGTERPEVERSLHAMHRHAASGGPRRDDFAMNALEAALLWCDRALFPYGAASAGRRDERILRAQAYLQAHLADPVSLAELAQTVGLSVSRLAHLFREQTGQTPQQFVETERMARARQMLERTTRPIAAIALEVGFENPFYFSLRFKRHTGLSPRDWRQQRQMEDARGTKASN